MNVIAVKPAAPSSTALATTSPPARFPGQENTDTNSSPSAMANPALPSSVRNMRQFSYSSGVWTSTAAANGLSPLSRMHSNA